MSEPNLRALTSLRRLRKVETDEARRDLGDALAQETVLAKREAAMRRDLDAARRMAGDFDREAFAAWFRRARDERTMVADALRVAEAATAAARDTLAHRRLAETAVEEALAREMAAREAETGRGDQLALEDVSRGLRRTAIDRGRN